MWELPALGLPFLPNVPCKLVSSFTLVFAAAHGSFGCLSDAGFGVDKSCDTFGGI